MTPYERVIAERLQAEAAVIPLPPHERWVPRARRGSIVPSLFAVGAVLLLVVATFSALGGAAGDVPRALATLRALVRPQSQTVPAGWSVFVSEGLLLAIPAEFGPPRPGNVPIFGGPNAPTLLRHVEFDRGLSILVWKGTVRRLLDESWLRGRQQPYSRRPLRAPLSGEEIVTTEIGQSDPVGGRKSGTDEHRDLFLQVAADEIAHIALGPTSSAEPGTATSISAADRALQDQIAAHLRPAPDVDRNIDRAQVEAILRRVIGQQQNTDVPPGDPSLPKLFAGEQWVYNWPNSAQSFAYVVVYPDRAARERDVSLPLVEWIAPVTQRGIGNVLVLVGSNDANLRYRILAGLDELTR